MSFWCMSSILCSLSEFMPPLIMMAQYWCLITNIFMVTHTMLEAEVGLRFKQLKGEIDLSAI